MIGRGNALYVRGLALPSSYILNSFLTLFQEVQYHCLCSVNILKLAKIVVNIPFSEPFTGLLNRCLASVHSFELSVSFCFKISVRVSPSPVRSFFLE